MTQGDSISKLPRTSEAEREAARKELRKSGARTSLINAVRFAHDNVSNPKDKETLARVMAYLDKEPGESPMAEVIFCHEQMAAFERRGILQDSALLDLRRRRNLDEARNVPSQVDKRVVDIPLPGSRKDQDK